MKVNRSYDPHGFTLIEVVLFVAILSITASAAYLSVKSAQDTARDNKLTADAAHVNEVLQIYLANGGPLPTSYSSSNMVNMLKTRADTNSSATTMGLTSSYIDPRTVAVDQTDEEAASTQVRAVWTGSGYTVMSGPGPKGIKRFDLDDTLSGTAPGTAARDPGVLNVATNSQWVWDYTDRQPTTVASGTLPVTGTRTGYSSTTSTSITQLPTPTVPSGTVPLLLFGSSGYPVSISANAPAGSSQLYYSLSTGAGPVLYSGTISVDPNTAITAYNRSINPDLYSDSVVASGSISAQKVTLAVSLSMTSTVTYAQAGGAMTSSSATAPSATVTLTNASSIPSRFISSGKFQTYYGYNASGLSPASVSFSNSFASPQISLNIANWTSGATSLAVSAQLQALDNTLFDNSPVVSGTVSIVKTTLNTPTISPATSQISAVVPVSITQASGDAPTDARIYYTTDGSDPGINSTTGEPTSSTVTKYSSTFTPSGGSSGSITVRARVYGPTGYAQWFTPSSMAEAVYTIASSGLPEGAVVDSASINGTFYGSLVYAKAPSNGQIQFNSGAKVLDGNIYVPGTPEVRFQPPTTTVVAAGASVVQPTSSLPRTVVGGKDIQSDGTILTSSTDTRQIVDLTGTTDPSSYRINLDSSAYIEGKIFRRSTAPAMPSVTVPTGLTNYGSFNGSGTLAPGKYSSVTANSGATITLGIAGATTPAIYEFDGLNLNSGATINVVGPVILTFTMNPSISGTLGNVNHPEYLQVNVSTSGNFNLNSSSAVYAKIVAPYSTLYMNGTFTGSIVADSLNINSNGVAFTLPPVIGS